MGKLVCARKLPSARDSKVTEQRRKRKYPDVIFSETG
jgi:hypothetical protein